MFGLDHVATIARNQALGTNGRRQYGTLYTGVACLLLPLSRNAAIQQNLEPGRSFDCFFEDGTDVLVGDKLTVNGVNYLVKGIQPFTGIPIVSHVRALCESENANGL